MNKIGLLVVRNNGLEYFRQIWNRIKVIPSLHVAGLFMIKWKEHERYSKIKNIYGHLYDDRIIENVIELQGTSMIAIVILDSKPDPFRHSCSQCGKKTGGERLDNMNINRIKDDIRVQYGNIIHSADTDGHARMELYKFGIDAYKVTEILDTDIRHCQVGDAFSCDNILKQLNTLENGVKVWKPQS